MNIVYNGNSQKLKANMYFDMWSQTVVSASAKVAFISVSAARVLLTKDRFQLKSKWIDDIDKSMPVDINPLLQNSLLGRVPPVYTFFEDENFSDFDIRLTADDQYKIVRQNDFMTVTLYVSASDFTLSGFEAKVLGCVLTYKNESFGKFSEWVLPSDVHIEAEILGQGKKLGSADFKFTDIEINGSKTVEF